MKTPNIHTLSAIEISVENMPLYCPTDDTPLWNMHPRVYLALDEGNRACCPYCGTVYQLTGEQKVQH